VATTAEVAAANSTPELRRPRPAPDGLGPYVQLPQQGALLRSPTPQRPERLTCSTDTQSFPPACRLLAALSNAQPLLVAGTAACPGPQALLHLEALVSN